MRGYSFDYVDLLFLISLYLKPPSGGTVFGGDAIFDNPKMHPLNPPIVRGATYDAPPKRSKGGCRI